ncbi:MAG: signal recognition particle protein [Xanthomonadaceae bacterium]|nr:signal recognition particle protein [Xanthomonadaceae bacterium]
MFENLTNRLSRVLDGLRGRGRLTEDDVRGALREVRMALLEADVALPVVKDFIERVRARATGAEVLQSLTPGQAVVGIVHRELVAILGAPVPFELRARPPAVVLLAGLQGAGKTTSAAKLARWIRDTQKKRVMLASTDVYRPAAIQQLEKLAAEIDVPFSAPQGAESALARAAAALEDARNHSIEVLIVDTAGRLAVDEAMMDEVAALHQRLEPAATLFVVDAMTGQDAARTARAFHERLPLTGVVLTKADGDARGGAALSVREVTGAPLLFLGVGERTGALEAFDPERLARRILGMGDIVGLVEAAQSAEIDQGAAADLAQRLKAGDGFTLADFRAQMQQMQKLGGIGALKDALPAKLAGKADLAGGDRTLRRLGGIIDSMTPAERRHPELIKASRKRRIAAGSGTTVQEVNRLLKQFAESRKMMKKLKGGGMARLMRGLGR